MNVTDIMESLQPVEFDAGTVFGGKASGTKVKGYEKPCAFTTRINPNYIFHESSRDIIVWLIAPPTPLYVCGVMGAGKSTGISLVGMGGVCFLFYNFYLATLQKSCLKF